VSIPIFRISLANANLVSALYLGLSVVLEASRRWFPFEWTDRAAQTCRWIPSRALDLVGLFEPLREAAVYGQLSPTTVRIILGATSVLLIFTIAMAVGALMWLGRWVFDRLSRAPSS
jgi:hypothetical protein